MNALIDISGHRYGRWTVLSYSGEKKWMCRCDCGTEKNVDGASLRRGATLGCISCHPALGNQRTHGGRRTRLYNIWIKMIDRCENPSADAYPRYGGRGISIWSEWRADFSTFRDWAVANGYADHLTIDRFPDNSGNYEPSNCRWATYAEQNRNYSRNNPINHNGRSVLIGDLAAEHGLPGDVVKNRIRRYGWTIEKALSTPVLQKGQRS